MRKKFMSKKTKLFISLIFISSLMCYISGFVVLLNTGYDPSKFTSQIKSLNFSTIKFYLSKNYFDFSLNQSTSLNEYSLDNSIDSLYFNLASQDIEVKSYDGDVIQVRVKGPKLLTSTELLTSKNNNTLTFSPSNNMDSHLYIMVNLPQKLINNYDININTSTGDISTYNISTDSLNLSTNNGDIYLAGSSVNYLSLEDSSGDINISNNITCIESKLSLNSGDISANGNLGLLTLKNVSGDTNLNLNELSNDISLTSISGDVVLVVPDNSDYKTDYSSISGNLLCSQLILTNGNEEHNINITTTSGDTFIGHK